MLLGRKQAFGGYGGVTVAYTNMLGRDGVLVGGQGAFLVDHRLSLGGAGFGFTRSPSGPPHEDGTPREFVTGYGGFLMRYAAYADFPVYASLGILIGAGGVALATEHEHQKNDDWDSDDVETRAFFVAQPDVSLHVNVTRWFRFGVTVGYRIATPAKGFGFDAWDMGGAVAGGNLEFGWF